ncbi:hypothetical protein [Vulcanisaeta thermophila]|uniref:hypothetical protein n=1 Tax=Vulcanisaeta thermophila TaxID=867917 RepID=UPI000853AC56|nr:hypothetical protein [Vulcanisaeta thermophila]
MGLSEINLKDLSRYEDLISRITEYGASVRESVFNALPDELMTAFERVREIYMQGVLRGKGRVDSASIINEYLNVPRIEELLRYLLLTTVLFTGFRRLMNEKVYGVLLRNYQDIKPLLTDPSYKVIGDLSARLVHDYGGSEDDVQEVYNALHGFVYGIRKLTGAYKTTLVKWLPRFTDVGELEESLQIFYPPRANERRRRAIRTFIRWVSHESNLPVALGLILRGRYRSYMPIVDIYSSMVTIRSGAFLALGSERVGKLLHKILTNRERAVVRIDEVKGIVRSTARLSSDPILFERGAFRIGHDYCVKLKCDECPLNRYCMKITWVVMK